MRHLILSALILAPGAAFAGRCDIFNSTNTSFTVESGNTSGQGVGAHTHTSIASGKIIGKASGGKSVGGSCRDGEKVKIVEEKGVFMIVPQ